MSVSRVSKWVLTRIDRVDTNAKRLRERQAHRIDAPSCRRRRIQILHLYLEQYLVPRFLPMDVKILPNPSRVAEKPEMPNKSVNQR